MNLYNCKGVIGYVRPLLDDSGVDDGERSYSGCRYSGSIPLDIQELYWDDDVEAICDMLTDDLSSAFHGSDVHCEGEHVVVDLDYYGDSFDDEKFFELVKECTWNEAYGELHRDESVQDGCRYWWDWRHAFTTDADFGRVPLQVEIECIDEDVK